MTGKERDSERKRSLAGVVIIAGTVLLVSVGAGVYALVTRLPDQAIWFILGGGLTLVILAAAIGLLIVKDLAQAYLVNRLSSQQRVENALLARMVAGRAPVVNLRPQTKQLPWSVQMPQEQPHVVSGEYRQTFDDGLEIQ